MMRITPKPARASREARAEPVAPQPTITMRDAVSLRWPSAPIPRKSTCREYLSSSSKEVISSTRTNHYDGCHAVCKTGSRGRYSEHFRAPKKVRTNSPGVRAAEYNIVRHGFIELSNQLNVMGEPVCN